MEDEEYAEMVLDNEADEPNVDYHPPLVGWTPSLAALTDIKDILASQTQTIIGVNGGKAKKPKYSPRPQTAIEKLREKRSLENQTAIIDMFRPR